MDTNIVKTGRPGSPGNLGLKYQGFTLIETLITMAVLSVGLAGLAAMDVLSYRKTSDSLLRAQAILQAQEMTGRMHANPAGVSAGGYNNISGSVSSPPDCIDKTSTTVAAASSTSCTATQIASFDADEWLTSTASILPGGAGTVTGPDGNGVYAIVITWQETISSAETSTKSFSFDFRPLP